jgi:hypothetical protein
MFRWISAAPQHKIRNETIRAKMGMMKDMVEEIKEQRLR